MYIKPFQIVNSISKCQVYTCMPGEYVHIPKQPRYLRRTYIHVLIVSETLTVFQNLGFRQLGTPFGIKRFG